MSGCSADHYVDYATQLATFVVNMTAAGVPIYAIAMQNEPSTAQDYETCIFTDTQLHTFIPYLYNALAVAGVGSTKIIMPEASSWTIDGNALPTLGDPTTAAMVGIVSAHGYGVPNPSAFNSQYVQDKPVWETEDATTDVYDPSISNGLTWATTVHNYLTNGNVSAWHYWEAVWPPSWQPPYGTLPDNSALTDANGNLAKRAYVLGQWAKFVRPGYQRIDVTNGTSLLVTAFADPVSHNWAIVAINSSGSASAQTFNVAGSQASSVTPWVTSSTLSLAQQSPVPVSGGNFSYTLPAQSIVSLVGSESTAPPTNTPTATPVPGTATNTPRSMATWTPTVTPTNTARGTPTATATATPTPRRHRRRP